LRFREDARAHHDVIVKIFDDPRRTPAEPGQAREAR
jgi:hypothetical protein